MDFCIRHEREEDYFAVENLLREVFWNRYFEGCNEHFIAHNIRTHIDYIPKLSFVIEKCNKKADNTIIGTIFFTCSMIKNGYDEFPTITFGPVAIHKDFQGKGLGKRLIANALIEAKKFGYKVVTICGYPYHYKSFGFLSSKAYGITAPDGKFYTGLMMLPLEEGVLDNVQGSIYFSSVFDEYPTKELEEFDSRFPSKIKQHQASQDEFKKSIVEIDNTEY